MAYPFRFKQRIHQKRCASCVLFSASMLSATGNAYTMLRQNEWCYSDISVENCQKIWFGTHLLQTLSSVNGESPQ